MFSFFRLIKIIHTLASYHLDDFIKPLPFSFFPRLLIKLLPSYWFFYFLPQRKESLEARLRLALIELGPIFIKLGQLMATRRDLLNDEIADELEQLTENVPPFDAELAYQLVRSELGEETFSRVKKFEKKPLAAASIAQVHEAQLQNGDQVVFKIVRPGIELTVNRDVRLMANLASLIESILPDARLFYLSELVENYRDVITGELNLYREAANTITMRNNALKHKYLYIPRVYLDFSTRKVMCVERIYAIPVNQADAIKAQGSDLKKLAENGVKIFFTQVFKDNFFHADMHPGNIFINSVNPQANQYASIDCAIVGSLSRQDQLFLGQQLLALIQKNYMKNAQLLIDAGWVTEDIHKEELALRLQRIVEPIFDQAMSDIEFAPILFELLTMAREFHIRINPDFLLFQKTLIHIEGLGKQLYPELNVWEVGKPLLEEWIRELFSPKYVFDSLKDNAPELLQQLPEIPALLYQSMNQLKKQGPDAQQNLLEKMEKMQSKQNRKNTAIVTAVLCFSGATVLASGAGIASMGLGASTLAGAGFIILVYQLFRS